MSVASKEMNKEETRKFLARNKPPSRTVTYTFSIEIIRFFASICLGALFAAGIFFTNEYVFIKDWEDSRALLRGQEEADVPNVARKLFFGIELVPYINPKEKKIYEIFGWLHMCTYVDFNPAKEIAAILLPLFSFPMSVFVILNHFRIKLSVMNGECPPWFYKWSLITSPLNLFVFQMVHLWFVNSPDMEYPDGVGFLGHYLPFCGFQTALAITSFTQVQYNIFLKKIPFGLPEWSAKFYVQFFCLLTLAYQIIVVSILCGTPILDSKKGGDEGTWERVVFIALDNMYIFCCVVGIFASGFETFNGDTNSFTIAHQ